MIILGQLMEIDSVLLCVLLQLSPCVRFEIEHLHFHIGHLIFECFQRYVVLLELSEVVSEAIFILA